MLRKYASSPPADTPDNLTATVYAVLRKVPVDVLNGGEVCLEDIATPCATEFLFEPECKVVAHVDSSIVFVEIVSHDVAIHKCLANEFEGSYIAILDLAKSRTDSEYTGR